MPLTVVLDLDDTLYMERDYVRSGIAAVGRWLECTRDVPNFASAAQERWETGVRGTLFDQTLSELGIAFDPSLIAAMVGVYRSHRPEIQLAPDAAAFVRQLKDWRAALVTDGPYVAQRRKIAALELPRLGINPIICTDAWGREFWKPNPRAFQAVQVAHRAAPAECVYVGDNPAKDFLGPRMLGWRTVQIDRPAAIHPRCAPSPRHAAEFRIASLDELAGDRLAEFMHTRPAAVA